MSTFAHPNLAAWRRDAHAGHYEQELADAVLRVVWEPGTRERRGRFRWEVSREGERPRLSEERYEEPEIAMAEAEAFARADEARRAGALARAAEEAAVAADAASRGASR
jgi:hypothetical protein